MCIYPHTPLSLIGHFKQHRQAACCCLSLSFGCLSAFSLHHSALSSPRVQTEMDCDSRRWAAPDPRPAPTPRRPTGRAGDEPRALVAGGAQWRTHVSL